MRAHGSRPDRTAAGQARGVRLYHNGQAPTSVEQPPEGGAADGDPEPGDAAEILHPAGRQPGEISYYTAAQVCRRYGGIADVTLWRWLQSESLNFPRPVYINRRRYFIDAELDAFDARRQLDRSDAA